MLGSSESSNDENPESNNGRSSGGDDGEGGGGGDNNPPGGDWWKNFREINPQGFAIGVALAAVGALLLMNASGMESREINWQEFRTKYLERGEVSVQYCAKVMQMNFDEFPGFLWLFDENSLETKFR